MIFCMPRARIGVMARSAFAVLAMSSVCAGQSATQQGPIEWITEDGGSLQLKLVRMGPCGGVLTVDSIRRLVQWEGAPGRIGCRDGFEVPFDDVKAVRTRSQGGFVFQVKGSRARMLELVPLPYGDWFAQEARISDPAVTQALQGITGPDSRGGDPQTLPNNLATTPTIKRVAIPKELTADSKRAIDRILEMLGRPAPPAAVLREALYGTPADMTVAEVIETPVPYFGKAVRIRGRLEPPAGTTAYRLVDGDQSLAVVPEADLAPFVQSQMGVWKDREVELVGVFRRGEESVAGPSGYLVSFWDCIAPTEASAPVEGEPTTLAALFANPAESVGKTVRVVGKFRGQNLFGDLPQESIRFGGDWVIKDDRYALWVIGKPAGDGFALDGRAPGDTSAWVELVAKPVVHDGRLLLRARSVTLVPPPPGARVVPTRQLVGRDTPPAVVFSLPVEGDAVAPDTRFVIQFSKQMDEESFTGRIRLRYTGGTGTGSFRVTARYDDEHRSLVVNPGTPLLAGRKVEIQLLPGIIDVDGMALEPRPGHQAEGAVDVLRFPVEDQR
jgi:Bacterial Ig-like domain